MVEILHFTSSIKSFYASFLMKKYYCQNHISDKIYDQYFSVFRILVFFCTFLKMKALNVHHFPESSLIDSQY